MRVGSLEAMDVEKTRFIWDVKTKQVKFNMKVKKKKPKIALIKFEKMYKQNLGT